MPGRASLSTEDVLIWLRSVAVDINAQSQALDALDAAIGDSEHGANLRRGMIAVIDALPDVAGQDIGTVLKQVGMTLVSTVGGASGPLYGTFFLQLGGACAGKTELNLDDWVAALRVGVNGVGARGRAVPNDKTMLDALFPALEALVEARDQGLDLTTALGRSAAAAEVGAVATIPMLARKGRASYLGDRCVGHQDPGATSSALILRALARSFLEDQS